MHKFKTAVEGQIPPWTDKEAKAGANYLFMHIIAGIWDVFKVGQVNDGFMDRSTSWL